MPLMYCCCFSGTRPKHNVFCVTVFAISRSRCCIILLPAIDSWRFFAGLMRERRRFWAWRRAVWGRSSSVSEHLAQQHSSRHQRPPSTTSPSARSDVTCTHVSPTRSSWQSSVYWMGWLPMGSCDKIPQRARCVESCIRWGSATDQRNERCMSERRRWTSSAAAFKLCANWSNIEKTGIKSCTLMKRGLPQGCATIGSGWTTPRLPPVRRTAARSHRETVSASSWWRPDPRRGRSTAPSSASSPRTGVVTTMGRWTVSCSFDG